MKYYKLEGKTVVSCVRFTHQDIAERRVGLHQIGEYSVSTVFLTIDHSFGGYQTHPI